ncbi:unnamed protein product [Sphagnum troendelagicum]|uniref:Ubiquitin thioesterase OTU n=1 Tax=Sphagnum troendelagicum TaxID=128251 RepID=A0ABP0V202_9BRYO
MAMTSSLTVLSELANGTAFFEYVETNDDDGFFNGPFASISSAFADRGKKKSLFFARIGASQGTVQARQGTSQAMKKVEHYTVRKVTGDGRCMFRALVQGMATNKGLGLNPTEEQQEADQLRFAVMDAICRSDNRRHLYEEALIAITLEESLKRYCQRIPNSNFWGGESELLVLSRMCLQPIIVYIPEAEARRGGKWGTGFIPIAEYGREYLKPGKNRKPRKPVRLLYSGSNHYDLLV